MDFVTSAASKRWLWTNASLTTVTRLVPLNGIIMTPPITSNNVPIQKKNLQISESVIYVYDCLCVFPVLFDMSHLSSCFFPHFWCVFWVETSCSSQAAGPSVQPALPPRRFAHGRRPVTSLRPEKWPQFSSETCRNIRIPKASSCAIPGSIWKVSVVWKKKNKLNISRWPWRFSSASTAPCDCYPSWCSAAVAPTVDHGWSSRNVWNMVFVNI